MENTVEIQYGLDVWMRFLRKISENREIEDMAADELNILICRFMMDKKERWRCVRANNSHFILFLPSFSGKKMKMLLTGLGRSALEETVPEAGNNK